MQSSLTKVFNYPIYNNFLSLFGPKLQFFAFSYTILVILYTLKQRQFESKYFYNSRGYFIFYSPLQGYNKTDLCLPIKIMSSSQKMRRRRVHEFFRWYNWTPTYLINQFGFDRNRPGQVHVFSIQFTEQRYKLTSQHSHVDRSLVAAPQQHWRRWLRWFLADRNETGKLVGRKRFCLFMFFKFICIYLSFPSTNYFYKPHGT